MINNSARLNGIQLLRAIAVLLVVHIHVLGLLPNNSNSGMSYQRHFFYLEYFGAVGVDIFFVISGFIITTISVQYARQNQPVYFLCKRLIRVIPVYWLVSLIPVVHYCVFGGKAITGTAIIKTICFFPIFDKTHFDTPLLFVGWTLSFEVFFYCLVFISMLFNKRHYILITVFLLLFLTGLNLATGSDNKLLQFFGNGIMLEFVMGVLIGLLYVSSFQFKKLVVNSLLAAGITGLLASVFLDYGKISGVGYTLDGSLTFKRVLLWGMPAALLVGSLVLNEKSRLFSIHPWWTLIGDASYSIYLTHAVILASLYVRWVEWGIIKKLSPDALLVLSMLLAITGGCIFYKLVELPILRFMNKQLAIANNSIARNRWFLKLVKDTA